jgi:hypothetical protein
MDLVPKLTDTLANMIDLFLRRVRLHGNDHCPILPRNEKAHSLGVGWPFGDTFFVPTNATLLDWSKAPIPVTKVCKRVGVGVKHRN